jgi:hypothetical protein
MDRTTRYPKCSGITIRGRIFTQADLVTIRLLIRKHPSWGRTRLSEEVCNRLNWLQPNGRPKDRACRVALLQLEGIGYLRLPIRKTQTGGRPPLIDRSFTHLINGDIGRLMPDAISCNLVEREKESRIWNSLIASHHYLGLGRQVGRTLRYLIYGDGHLVAAIGFSEAAWSVRDRDYILEQMGGQQPLSRDEVISNNRFLILPGVTIPNLASRILSQSTRLAATQWQVRYGSAPVLAETFVDPARYSGACYLASNWVVAGQTKGYAKSGASHSDKRTPKLLLMRGLTKRIHQSLSLICPPGSVHSGPHYPRQPKDGFARKRAA